jgi:hypothetical protein
MDLYENRSENSLKGDPSNDITVNPPLFSLVNTFKHSFIFLDLEKISTSPLRGMVQPFN